MFSPSDYNDAVPQFSNGNYANEPLNPLYVEEPDDVNYKRGAEPLQTLPVQWWNWLWNKITAKLNNLNIYVKNIFNELAALLSLVNVTPDATKEEVTTEQLKDMFATKYPQYLYNSDIFKTKYPQYLYNSDIFKTEYPQYLYNSNIFKTEYPQYLNDNFNFESLLQGRTRGVMVAPTDTWNNNTNRLSLTGGFGIINTYHKVTFSDCNLVIPNDTSVHFIVSNTSGVISIQNSIANNVILIGLCSNKQYCLLIDNNPDQCKDNIILKKWFGQHNISQNFVPALQSYYDTAIASIETNISIETVDVGGYGIKEATLNNSTINIGTLHNGDGIFGGTLDNCTITIETLNGGYGIEEATLNNSTINIETVKVGSSIHNCTLNNSTINIGTVTDGYGIYNDTLNNCTITIETVGVNSNKCYGIRDCTLNTCIITIGTVNSGYGIYGGIYNNCTITVGTVTDGYGISKCTLNNSTITIKTVNYAYYDYGISHCISDNCTITIETVNGGIGIVGSTFNTCTIIIKTSTNNGQCIYDGTYNNSTITIETVNSGIGIRDDSSVVLYLTYIKCSAITSLSNTAGKLNVLNDTVFHAS